MAWPLDVLRAPEKPFADHFLILQVSSSTDVGDECV